MRGSPARMQEAEGEGGQGAIGQLQAHGPRGKGRVRKAVVAHSYALWVRQEGPPFCRAPCNPMFAIESQTNTAPLPNHAISLGRTKTAPLPNHAIRPALRAARG